MFALLKTFSGHIQTSEPNASSKGGTLDLLTIDTTALDMASTALPILGNVFSTEPEDESSGLTIWEEKEEQPAVLLDPSSTTANTDVISGESAKGKMINYNRIPAKPISSSEWWRHNWTQEMMKEWVELADDQGFSGNGLTEIETRNSFLLQQSGMLPSPSNQNEVEEEEVDIFEDQIYLPAGSVGQFYNKALTVPHETSVSNNGKSASVQLHEEPQNSGEGIQGNFSTEGSAFPPLSFH
ncbi:hypothetical protein scyTo_0003124 [Scyliorhinus torazame]|uniref:Uncharacterized protein n=2 Tax=Scyliorhinus torazame TaxID=75743 RepID=A0A401PLN8_SCYTO|nr:hypothetical protein [Scyliorhinus torazame]